MKKLTVQQLIRIIFTILLLGFAVLLLSFAATRLPISDFSTYWAAGRLNLTGANPYDNERLLALERTVGWVEEGVHILLNPPWTLSLMMPFGMLDYQTARAIWLLGSLIAFIGCAAWAWGAYGGKPSHRWFAMLMIVVYGPLAHLLKVGQITWLMVLGITGFVYFIRREQYFWAGALASLILIKPQLLYMIPLAIGLWSLQQHKWGILVGMITAILVQLLLAMLPNPNIISQFIYSLLHSPPSNWQTASLGAALRVLIGPENFWLQFVPTILGALGFLGFWIRYRHQWDWVRFTPGLAIASVATAAYSWTHDTSVAYLALIQAAVFVSHSPSKIYKLAILAIYILFCLATMLPVVPQYTFWWIGIFLFGMYLLIYQQASTTNQKIDLHNKQSVL